MYTSSEKYVVMRKDAIFIANALNAYYNVDTFNIKLFKLEEV